MTVSEQALENRHKGNEVSVSIIDGEEAYRD
jgi:hypothetical protein